MALKYTEYYLATSDCRLLTYSEKMATATQTIQKPFIKPSRNYDYLYDPTFTVSSQRDHAKESYKAQTSFDRIRRVPNFKTMFSSLRHHPRQTITLDMTDPVPKHVSRQWKGYSDQARQTLIRYKKFNYDPTVQVPPKFYPETDAEGKDRYKFFRRPIIPFLPQMPPSVVLAPQQMESIIDRNSSEEVSLIPPQTRNVYVQTDYRDSETQTDPYSPEYVVKPGSQPELLTLATLCYGKGLPAGLSQVEMIERARAKRAWESTLPDLNDLSQAEKRRCLMEEQERLEWSYRESEISEIQNERMELLRKMLQQREVDYQAINDKRIEHLWSKRQREKERQIRRVRSEHVKALRKLTENRQHLEGKRKERNIIKDYTNFDSQVYAPMTRIGVYLDAGSEQFTVKNRYNTTLDGILDLETTLSDSVTNIMTKPPDCVAKPVGNKARKQVKLGKILDQMYSDLQNEKLQTDKGEKPIRLLEKVEKPIPRPPTPTIDAPTKEEEEQELAIILLQRVIRGRAIQNKMIEGKEMRSDMIEELRTTHALQSPEQQEKKKETEAILGEQRARERQEHKEAVIVDGAERSAAELMGRQLDFLNKELIRLQEERRIHAYVMLATRERRMREAEESGRRQREERVRRTEDEIFKQMMRVHQGTVDTYLEDVILQSMERTADKQAREEIHKQAETINKLAVEFENTRDELQSKEMVAEMVYYFLLPEVEKQTTRDKVKHTQRKHLLAAHRIVYGEVDKLISQNEDMKDKEMTSDKYSVNSDMDREERKVVITLDKEKEVVGINEEMDIKEKITEMTSEKEKEDVTEQSSSSNEIEKKNVDEITHDVDD